MTSIVEMNIGTLEIIYLVITFISALVFTFLFIPYLISIMKRKGIVGFDIHKNAKPEIAESGGLSILLGLILSSLLLIIFFPLLINEILVFILTVIICGIIGFIDDRIKLRSFFKILFTLFTGSAFFLANYFGLITIRSPTIPFLGETRLTMIYPLVTPIIVAIFANTSNMLEGYNGEGSGTSLIALFFLLICSILWNSAEALVICLSAIAVLIPFFLYNKFPAKIFPGDVGTLSIGAVFASIALLGSLEVAVFCALLIHIINSFYVIRSVKGFFESREIQEKKNDIILLPDDKISASDKKDAVLTLPRLILAKGPLTEPQLVKNFYIISVICGFFSIIAVMFTLWTIGDSNLNYIIIFVIIFSIPTGFLLYFFPRIRGIIILMILLLIIICLVLIFIDSIVMKYFQGDFELLFIKIPYNILFSFILIIPALAIWYYITIRYFWMQINKMKN
jgi:UDP-N-acetylmuramyl pentapeptide phosphotransferase/UDP-N-acetylglucosamine-1-phosphate transferase